MKGSCDAKKGVKAKHIVSVWANECPLVLAQEKVFDKSNEITAIPRLLERLDLQGRIVTLESIGLLLIKMFIPTPISLVICL